MEHALLGILLPAHSENKMSSTVKGLLALVAFFLVVGIVLFFMNVSYENESVRLKTRASAQQEVCKTVCDTMYTVIKEKAQIKESYAEDLRNMIQAYVEGRGAAGGSLMKWVSENNPTLDPTIYKDLGVTVEAQRAEFQRSQKELLSVKQQHDALIGTFPGSFFINDQTPISVQIIISSSTRNVYSTGTDDRSPLEDAKKK